MIDIKHLIVVDIDGTVSKVGDRLECLSRDPKNWDEFYNRCDEDAPVMEIVHLLHALTSRYSFVFCTGRRESVRGKTQAWLADHGLIGKLVMRPDGDFRHDTIVKFEMLEKANIKLKNIAFVLEDRNSMVKAFREKGIKCLQVADGDF